MSEQLKLYTEHKAVWDSWTPYQRQVVACILRQRQHDLERVAAANSDLPLVVDEVAQTISTLRQLVREICPSIGEVP